MAQDMSVESRVSEVVDLQNAWERWFVSKEMQRRKRSQEKFFASREHQAAVKKNIQEQKLKKKVVEERVKNWQENKKKENLQRQKQMMEEKSRILEEEERKAVELKIRADKTFKDWLAHKKRQEAEQKNKIKLINEEKMKLMSDKRRMNSEAFQKWLKVSKTRPKPIPDSIVFVGDRMIDLKALRK